MKCPRCDNDNTRKMVNSPVGNVWEVFVCQKCWYSWRSTETINILEKFKLNDEKIAQMEMIPPIPPLKR